MSHGIDLVNYGILSSKGASKLSHPFTCALLAAHNTVRMYQNGRQVHSGSNGNGIITLDSSIGNEMSHDAGHNYDWDIMLVYLMVVSIVLKKSMQVEDGTGVRIIHSFLIFPQMTQEKSSVWIMNDNCRIC